MNLKKSNFHSMNKKYSSLQSKNDLKMSTHDKTNWKCLLFVWREFEEIWLWPDVESKNNLKWSFCDLKTLKNFYHRFDKLKMSISYLKIIWRNLSLSQNWFKKNSFRFDKSKMSISCLETIRKNLFLIWRWFVNVQLWFDKSKTYIFCLKKYWNDSSLVSKLFEKIYLWSENDSKMSNSDSTNQKCIFSVWRIIWNDSFLIRERFENV